MCDDDDDDDDDDDLGNNYSFFVYTDFINKICFNT